jgi:hypothetical protein
MVGTVVQDGRATTVTSIRQPETSPISAGIRERAAAPPRSTQRSRATPQKIPDTRTENGVPAWKRRVVDSLAEQLDRRGAKHGSRARELLTAENVDARITTMARELRARAQDRTGYSPPGAARTGVVVNRAV